ncbi:MAG: hypothetical protein N0E56_15865 [Candidatus Thiodiazotropha endolucinida]|nr:hypothetical protein [Candidatus Thiodiazotropha taylori]MCW4268100.1 hypothetical protein [Candidatus Thiodiazotropha endolucinida]
MMGSQEKKTPPMFSKPCMACGGDLLVTKKEHRYKRGITCCSETIVPNSQLPNGCFIQAHDASEDTQVAVTAITESMSIASGRGKKHRENAELRGQVLRRYIDDIGAGEPEIDWYRHILQTYPTNIVIKALSPLPYWSSETLKLPSLKEVAPIDTRTKRLRKETNNYFADLLAEFVESRYELMHFSFDRGLFGKANPVKISTIKRDVNGIADYLEWIYFEGHETLQSASRSVLDEYLVEKGLSHPRRGYLIARFYKWVKKKLPFTPTINFNQRRRGSPHTKFETLNIKESQQAFQRICAHSDPRARALSLLALLYAQKVTDSIDLRLSDLKRNPSSSLWTIARPEEEAFAIEPELSAALDACIVMDSQSHTVEDDRYVFISKFGEKLSTNSSRAMIKAASGVTGSKLRRTAIVNMYRGGQKTLGTVVLREILNVSSPTIRRAIKATGDSVNTPTVAEDADELRRAFLEEDDD